MLKSIFGIQNNIGNPQRNEFLDFLRGFAMLLVIYHHIGGPGNTWIISFHMPLFFILSGYTKYVFESTKKEPQFFPYLKARFIRLIIPYFSFELLSLIVYYIIWNIIGGKSVNLFCALRDIILCYNTDEYNGLTGRLWFLPCIFICDSAVFLLTKYIKNKRIIVAISVSFFVLSWAQTNYLPFDIPFTLGTVLMAIPFSLFGYIFSASLNNLISKNSIVTEILLLLFCIIVMLLTLNYGNAYIYMYKNEYGNYFSTIACSICGSLVAIVFSKYLFSILKRVNCDKFIRWYGFNSLAVFPVHMILIRILQETVETAGGLFEMKISLNWIIEFIFVSVVTIPVVNLINNYLPFMLGIKRKNNKNN